MCRYHNINLCRELTNIGTSHQENLNSIKNNLRLRSTCNQTPARHLMYNMVSVHFDLKWRAIDNIGLIMKIMDQYHNEKIVGEQTRRYGTRRDEIYLYVKK